MGRGTWRLLLALAAMAVWLSACASPDYSGYTNHGAYQPPVSRPPPPDDFDLIQASRASHNGTCPCPYDYDAAGNKCGDRSAYSRGGGLGVLCYPKDVKTASLPAHSKIRAVTSPPGYNASPPAYSSSAGYGCGGSYYGATSCLTGLPKTTYVRGYYRKDGTYVRSHYRSRRR